MWGGWVGLGVDRSQSLFYFVPHSQAGSTSWGAVDQRPPSVVDCGIIFGHLL